MLFRSVFTYMSGDMHVSRYEHGAYLDLVIKRNWDVARGTLRRLQLWICPGVYLTQSESVNHCWVILQSTLSWVADGSNKNSSMHFISLYVYVSICLYVYISICICHHICLRLYMSIYRRTYTSFTRSLFLNNKTVQWPKTRIHAWLGYSNRTLLTIPGKKAVWRLLKKGRR